MKKKKTYKKFALSGDGIDTVVATSSQNCDCSEGIIRIGVGLEPLLDETGKPVTLKEGLYDVSDVFPLYITVSGTPIEYLGVFKGEGELYYYKPTANDGLGDWIFAYNFNAPTKVINTQDETGKRRTYFCNKNGISYYISTYCPTHITKAKPVGCFFEGRVFVAVSDEKIVFSNAYGFALYNDTLTDGGHVLIPEGSGAICAIVPFQNKLYVLCDYGIFVMDAVGSAGDFTLKTIEYNGTKIFGDSVGICSDGIYFLTEKGVCVFDGKHLRKICTNVVVEPITDGQKCMHAEYDGKYHVCFLGPWKAKKSLVVDCATGEGYYAFAPKAIASIRKQGYCVSEGTLYMLKKSKLLPANATRYFLSGRLTFGTDALKTLHKVTIRAFGTITFSVSNGKTEKTFTKSFDGGADTFPIRLRANWFLFRFQLKDDAYISEIVAEYETLS